MRRSALFLFRCRFLNSTKTGCCQKACTLAHSKKSARFVVSERRVRLFEKLCELVKEEQAAGLALELFVDGSFVTDSPMPNDIDLVLVLSSAYNPDVELAPFQYSAISKAALHRRYSFDVFVARQGSRLQQDQIEFFCKTREGQRKGILRITL